MTVVVACARRCGWVGRLISAGLFVAKIGNLSFKFGPKAMVQLGSGSRRLVFVVTINLMIEFFSVLKSNQFFVRVVTRPRATWRQLSYGP